MTPAERQRQLCQGRRARGECCDCEAPCEANPRTGKPYVYCGPCRVDRREHAAVQYAKQLARRGRARGEWHCSGCDGNDHNIRTCPVTRAA